MKKDCNCFEIHVYHKFSRNIDLPLKVLKVKQNLIKKRFYFQGAAKLLNSLPLRIRKIKLTKIRKRINWTWVFMPEY